MRNGSRISVIIPALNEEQSIGKVIDSLPNWVDEIIVADNGSTDGTARTAEQHGARVVREPRRGYGAACLAAMARLRDPEVVVFLDGDFSDFPEETALLVDPILSEEADLVIGSRVLGVREPGALTFQAQFGNWIACRLIHLIWNARYTDLGPFRAIRHSALVSLGMRDRDYGWTVEMQIKAAMRGMRVKEVPVSYRRRIGKSKVSGTVRGVVGAGVKILGTIFLASVGILSDTGREGQGERVIVFTRYPEAGKTKTRLIPAIGATGAANLHKSLTERAVAEAGRVRDRRGATVEIRYEGSESAIMAEWLGHDLDYREQESGDLGDRMFRAFEESLRGGFGRVVLFGTDLPGLSADIITRGLSELDRHDLVLGPARDGGYYLIGMKRPYPELFDSMEWSNAHVLSATLDRARGLGLSTTLLEPLNDLDRPEDLGRFAASQPPAAGLPESDLISVIVPSLNEGRNLLACLESVRSAGDVEIIVVDGGSSDDTVALAHAADVKVLVTDSGRGRQMNAGAAAASGGILLFLHADSVLPRSWNRLVRSALSEKGVSAGAFELGLNAESPAFRFIERAANFRSRTLQTPYGDQGIFLTREMFRQMGGFPEIPLMEDLELVRNLRKQGRIAIVPERISTSARRWRKLGVLRATLINQVLLAAYFLGIRPRVLSRWYNR